MMDGKTSEICTAFYKNKYFERLVHLVGCTVGITKFSLPFPFDRHLSGYLKWSTNDVWTLFLYECCRHKSYIIFKLCNERTSSYVRSLTIRRRFHKNSHGLNNIKVKLRIKCLHPSSCNLRVADTKKPLSCKWPTWRTILFSCMFIPNLYMFQVLMCSSSGEFIVSIRNLVYVTVCRWPSGMQVWVPPRPAYQTITYIEWHIPDVVLIQ